MSVIRKIIHGKDNISFCSGAVKNHTLLCTLFHLSAFIYILYKPVWVYATR